MTEHKHAWALRLIADGVPLSELEVKPIQGGSGWITPVAATFVYQPEQYLVRRKQRTHVVNGFTVLAPEKVTPADRDFYWIPSLIKACWYDSCQWDADKADYQFFKRSMVFLTKEAAIMNAKAMCKIDPYAVD